MIETSDDARVLYHGESSIISCGRSNTTGQWFKVGASDNDQFTEAMKYVSGNTPVYVTIGIEDGFLVNNMEFLLTSLASGPRSGNIFKLQFDELNPDLYSMIELCVKDESKIDIAIIAGQYHEKESTEVGEHKDLSKRVRTWGMLCHPEFLKYVGNEDKYIKWIQKQPCVLSGSFWKNPETGDELNEAAHIREIRHGAGTAIKPKYYVVPLHYKLHRWQHDHSMTELWRRYSYDKGCPTNKHYRRLSPVQAYPIINESHAAHAFFEFKAHTYMREWAISEVVKWAGVSRLSYVSEEKWDAWLTDIGASSYIGVV